MSKYRNQNKVDDLNKFSNSTKFIWALAILIIGAFLGLMVFSKKQLLDSETGCPPSSNKYLTVLVDISDELQSHQIESLYKRFETISDNSNARSGESNSIYGNRNNLLLNKGDKLSVYTVSDSEIPQRVFSMCSPGTSDEHNRFSKGKLIAQKEWEKFSNKMINLIKKIMTDNKKSYSKSYIIESIAYVRAKEFPPSDHIQEKGSSYNLVIISDLLQNSPLYSQYSKKYISPSELNDKFPVQLRGISVSVLFVPSKGYGGVQNTQTKTWWRIYFNSKVTGAMLTSWENI